MKLQKYIKKIKKLKKKSNNAYKNGNLSKYAYYELKVNLLQNLLRVRSK